MLLVKNVKKIYGKGRAKVEALSNVNFSAEKGEFIAIMGESGSGKTTLLNLIASLDRATDGYIEINGKNIVAMKDKDIAKFRRSELGFVFQEFNLLETFNNRDNIYLPLVLSDIKKAEMDRRLSKIQGLLGIEDLLNKFPHEISGGEKQRVAIARAIITKPSLVLADEPTGSLDSTSSNNIMDIFQKINNEGHTVIMVTHSVMSASYAKRVLFIKDGLVYHEIYKGDEDRLSFMEKINNAQSVIQRKRG
ncbi:MAG: bacteriocin ABC transporter ATP-binding protein [Clostridiales bacterium]|nr:MAG: bacteriocin ABC transporter ATP-binding protein [Clostridiales bacterium]